MNTEEYCRCRCWIAVSQLKSNHLCADFFGPAFSHCLAFSLSLPLSFSLTGIRHFRKMIRLMSYSIIHTLYYHRASNNYTYFRICKIMSLCVHNRTQSGDERILHTTHSAIYTLYTNYIRLFRCIPLIVSTVRFHHTPSHYGCGDDKDDGDVDVDEQAASGGKNINTRS